MLSLLSTKRNSREAETRQFGPADLIISAGSDLGSDLQLEEAVGAAP